MKSVEKLRIYGLKNLYFNRMLETMYQYMPNVEDIGGVTTSDDTIEALCEFLSTFQRLHRIDMVYDGMMWEEKFRAGLGVMRQYCPLMDHVTLWALGDAYYDKWTAVRETTNASWTWKIDNCKECTRHEEISPALLS
ncbi:hypothetical protein SISSUDRAFT_1044431 [Sistotremastrum suecicum HHB10207 ss-3]|uniref:Uncharacterized protein n=1 Tax=Sistotremastrum suecicum HHB10207 ss-3 TaxID=1314776 RepID=A0A166F762_9AGAM|nr:hypothetical protein SISSUDRAFT_1044431 [Sistotremastrum suecicum HHB10207 ss-3]